MAAASTARKGEWQQRRNGERKRKMRLGGRGEPGKAQRGASEGCWQGDQLGDT